MKLNFKCKDTEKLYDSGGSRRFQSIVKVALRKLDMLAAATTIDDLRIPPGNRLESLSGDRAGEYSIRINNQWRICFTWDEEKCKAKNVAIEDYH